MFATLIFGMQVVVNLLLYSLVARWHIQPRLKQLPLVAALTPLLLFQVLRTMGATFLLPGVVGTALPEGFAAPGAYGDLIAVTLALVSLFALRRGWRGALILVWLFSIIGLLDFLSAFTLGISFNIAANYALGPIWFIPTFAVPAFVVAQVLVIILLVTRGHEYTVARRQKPGVQPV